jgi:hypothetical protein
MGLGYAPMKDRATQIGIKHLTNILTNTQIHLTDITNSQTGDI